MTFLFQAKNGQADFGSEFNRSRFKEELKENEGRKYRIQAVSPNTSDNKRSWYFGAIIPFIVEINPAWENLTQDQVHEILKQEFNGFDALGIDGVKKRYGMSAVAREVPSEIFDNYILRIRNWVNENYGMDLPDPEYYKENVRDAVKLHTPS